MPQYGWCPTPSVSFTSSSVLLPASRFPSFYSPVALVNMINSTPPFFLSAPLPDDHSRVRLQALEGEQSSDYINANYVDVSTHTSQRHQRKGHCASSRGERGRWCRRHQRRLGGAGGPSAVCPARTLSLSATHTHTLRQELCLFILSLEGCSVIWLYVYIKRDEGHGMTHKENRS